MARTRIITNKIFEKLENGELEWETVCRECLCNMSEDDVAEMAEANDWLDAEAETIED